MGNYLNCFNSLCTLKMKKDQPKRVNICWELKDERKCQTLSRDEAYALKKYVDDNDGCVFWFQALDD
jgi:hypothetical protein